MKKSLICIVMLPTLISCTLTRVPLITNGHSFIDNNVPTISIEFPYNVSVEEEKKGYLDVQRYTWYRLSTERKDTRIFIKKLFIIRHNFFYSGTDKKLVKNKLYLDEKGSGYCTVGLKNHNGDTYFHGEVQKYSHDKELISVRIYRNIGNNSLPAEWWRNNKPNSSDLFIEDVKSICSQIFKG